MTKNFSTYQKFVIFLLAFLQFTIILDFMILSPLGAILIPTLGITPSQFSHVVSAYAFSAGISGFIAAGFADRFDRKKFLLFFYTGFIVATLLCGLAPNYITLLIARMLTGVFGGVIGSIVLAIATDLFSMEMRGRVMGVVQTSFAVSQILGLPLGLYLSNHFGWHAPFLMIVAIGLVVGILILGYLKPIQEHLTIKTDKSPLHHLLQTLTTPRYIQGFATTALLSTGGFMLMPFGSAFSVHNLGIDLGQLPTVYLVTGLFSIAMGPFFGRMADRFGKFPVFCLGSTITIFTVLTYTRLSVTPIEFVILINVIMFAGISGRMISSSALMSALPKAHDRGAYMSISASVQQISGGLAASLAGLIVKEGANGKLENYQNLGYVVAGTTLFTVGMMYFIDQYIKHVHRKNLKDAPKEESMPAETAVLAGTDDIPSI